MPTRSSRALTWKLPPWLRSDHPGFRAFAALFSTVLIVILAFGNLPDSALRTSMQPVRVELDNLGLYHRGWGMFAATNTSTSVVRTELTYSDGTIQKIQDIHYTPGYALSAWNEVLQDLQFDDNNDREGRYLSGYLRYTCKQYDTKPGNPLLTAAFEQQVIKIPARKNIAAEQVPFTTRQIFHCQSS